MNPDIFQSKLFLILTYVNNLNKRNVPINRQRVLVKTYANNLSIKLTNNMVFEILPND
ncbi:hypothetical protein [Wukongibacter sp. M2B1]|uniref:hypothetical protein n=1 Tax=Wukongibacter sp. M2B1 TaxID=3088895 RepID=UPI003D7A7111